MAYIQLRDMATGEVQDFHMSVVRVGRDPEFEIVPSGAVAEVVSGRHLMLIHDEGRWWIEDLGSSNGTYLDGEALKPGKRQPLVRGSVVRLGRAGPQFTVVQTAERVASPTRIEGPALSPDLATAPIIPKLDIPAPETPPKPEPLVVFLEAETGEQYVARGDRVRIGRSKECEVQLTRDEDTSVSRNHAELVLQDGRAVLRDLQSRNGTYVNGTKLDGECEIVVGDYVRLGPSGPELVLDSIRSQGPATATGVEPHAPFHASESPVALGSDWARRRNIDAQDGGARPPRSILRVFLYGILLVVLFSGGVVGFAALRGRRSEAPPAQTNDAAPSTGGDPVAAAGPILADASPRSGIQEQLAVVDSIRQALTDEVARLQSEVQRASETQAPQATLDSLRAAAHQSEDRAMAMSAVDFAAVVQANQAGIGHVVAYTDGQVATGTGFMLTASGFFLTSGDLVVHAGRHADSVIVTMVNRPEHRPARIVRVSDVPNTSVALLRIPEYDGPTVSGVDWDSSGLHAGNVGVVVGISSGGDGSAEGAAVVEPSVHAGVFGDSSPNGIQIDTFGRVASIGSPVCNASGRVVAIYGAPGNTLGVNDIIPVAIAEDLLPVEARRELRLPARAR